MISVVLVSGAVFLQSVCVAPSVPSVPVSIADDNALNNLKAERIDFLRASAEYSECEFEAIMSGELTPSDSAAREAALQAHNAEKDAYSNAVVAMIVGYDE